MNHKSWNPGPGKPDGNTITVKNAEASVEIPAGSPVIYAFNGTDDGLAVVLPSSSTAAKATSFMAGIAIRTLAVGQCGPAQVYGFCRNVRLYRGSRAASTDAWPSFAAVALADNYTIQTVANAMALNAAGSTSPYQVMMGAAETMASVTTMASSVLGTNPASALSYFVGLKAFLRMM